MLTWDNLFDGYNAYEDTFATHPNMYTEVSDVNTGVSFYDQAVKQLPYDLNMVLAIFFTSIVPFVCIAAFLYIFFMPPLRRPQQW